MNRSWTSAVVADTGIVTVLPVEGLKLYVADALMLVNVVALCSRPRTSRVCVRGPQTGSGFSLRTIEVITAFAPSLTVSVLGNAPGAPSQYVVTSSSLAFTASKMYTKDDAVIGLPTARFEAPLPGRVTMLLSSDWLPAASLARTW